MFDQILSHPANRKLDMGEGWYEVEHKVKGEFTRCYHFSNVPRNYSFFLVGTIQSSYTTVGFSPFLSGLRLIRFPRGNLTAIRDNVLFFGKEILWKKRLKNWKEFRLAIDSHFWDVLNQLPLEDAIRKLYPTIDHLLQQQQSEEITLLVTNIRPETPPLSEVFSKYIPL